MKGMHALSSQLSTTLWTHCSQTASIQADGTMTLTYVSMHHGLVPFYHFDLFLQHGLWVTGLQYEAMRGLLFGGLQCVLEMRKLQYVSYARRPQCLLRMRCYLVDCECLSLPSNLELQKCFRLALHKLPACHSVL